MHFDPEMYPGTKVFWEMLRVYWLTFSPTVKILLGGFLLVLIWFAVKGDKKERLFFVVSTFVLIAVCLNPWMCRYLVDKWGFFTRYFRLFWIIPVSMGYSLAGLKLYGLLSRKGRWIFQAVLITLMVFAITEVVRQTGFSDIYTGGEENTGMIPVDNIYKVEDELIEVSNIIEKDSGNPEEMKLTLYNRDIFIEMRTYNAAITPLVSYGRFPDYNYNEVRDNNDMWGYMCLFFTGKTEGVDTDAMNGDILKNAMAANDCKYVILPKDNSYYDVWVSSFTSLGDAGRYTILKVK